MTNTSFSKLILLLSGLLIIFISSLAILSKSARAHAEYARSEPPAGAVISEPPTEIHVWFTQELFRRENANALEVFGPDGVQVDQKDSQIDDDDRTHMFVSLQAGLSTGLYTVRWRTLSADDGDNDQGEFTFSVDAQATQTNPPAPEETTPAPPEPALSPTSTPAPTGPVTGQTNLACQLGMILGGLGLVMAPWWRRRGGA